MHRDQTWAVSIAEIYAEATVFKFSVSKMTDSMESEMVPHQVEWLVLLPSILSKTYGFTMFRNCLWKYKWEFSRMTDWNRRFKTLTTSITGYYSTKMLSTRLQRTTGAQSQNQWHVSYEVKNHMPSLVCGKKGNTVYTCTEWLMGIILNFLNRTGKLYSVPFILLYSCI